MRSAAAPGRENLENDQVAILTLVFLFPFSAQAVQSRKDSSSEEKDGFV